VPSFLVTKNMSPALALRVLRSVTGRRGAAQRLPRLTAILRLAALVMFAAAAVGVFVVRQQRSRELEEARAALLQRLEQEGATLTRADRELGQRARAALALHATSVYAGDLIAEELRSEAKWTAELALPLLYIRGPLDELARTDRLEQLAPGSWLDAFVLCLVEPPQRRSEAELRKKARAAGGRHAWQAMPQVERLDVPLSVLPVLGPDWRNRIALAETQQQLAHYRELLDTLPLRAAVRAAKSRRLLAVMDEPGDPKVPAELDGERPHAVRVILTDLTHGELRLRLRRDVDPSWLSAASRAELASGIDSCALAMELRAAVLGRASDGASPQ
jgi:hypothetical protein